MPRNSIAMALSAVVIATPASATEFEGKFGGWSVFKAEDNCAVTQQFEGPGATDFTLVRFVDGKVVTLVSNTNWSAQSGEKYDVTYILNGVSYRGEASGSSHRVRPGLLANFGEDFATDFAKGETLTILLGERIVDQLSLDGTAVAVRALDRCLNKRRAEMAVEDREKARFEHIPKDPFMADEAEPTGDGPRPAEPRNVRVWASQISMAYPSQALREELQGTVGVSVLISGLGRVTECAVTKSSGHQILDEAACAGMKRYARFSPAMDSQGQPINGRYSTSVTYSLN